jgi:hypothetical protein
VSNLTILTATQWWNIFQPIPNYLNDNATFRDDEHGYMFETYGDELEFVKAQEPNRIWTYCDGDDNGTYIYNGYYLINRIGYFITTVPYNDKKYYQIQIIDPKEE